MVDANWLMKEVKRGSPQWKVTTRWAMFLSAKRRALPSATRHSWDKTWTTVAVKDLVKAMKKGEVSSYSRNFNVTIPQWKTMQQWWQEFSERERVLLAEIVLAG